MTAEHPRRGTDDERESDPDNAVFRRAIDNVFKRVAKRRKENAEDAALRAREARKRADGAQSRQKRRKPDH
jgi:hypothetical protein